ncbi:MAG TPA: AMP-binding protein [Clostridia bacterium]|nr:AMP-binding protein [Clostridia bacterium]
MSSAVVSAFRKVASQVPDRAALIANEQTTTYSQLERRAAAAAAKIAETVKGNTVALLLPNNADFAPLFLGALWAGKTVAVMPTLAPPPLLKLMAAEARADVVITTEEFVPRLIEVQLHCWIADASGEADPAAVPMRELATETAVLLYTSGTTGRPKAVALSERNIMENAEGCRLATGFDGKQVMLAILPLFHAYGLTVTLLLPLISGATVLIPDRFVPRAILQSIEKYKVTCLVAVPSQYRLLAKDPTTVDTSSLWLCIAGAERLPEHVAQEFEERFNHVVVQGYGATEISPVVSLNMPEANRFGSVGNPLPNLKVTICDESDHVLAPNEVGEVCVEGSAVMLGYNNDPEATSRKICNGVLHTGDKGFIDNDGYLYLVGRADDLVKVSGEKVYPAEVETALETIEGVDEAAVVALPDEKHGARLHAFVQPLPGAALNEMELRAACREFMEPFKIPRSFAFVDQLPRTVTGKTDKRSLAVTAAG